MDRQAFYDDVRAYIVKAAQKRGVATSAVEFTEDSNLFDIGLVNSYSMVNLLMYVERLLGISVDVTEHDPEAFFTLRGLFEGLADQAVR